MDGIKNRLKLSEREVQNEVAPFLQNPDAVGLNLSRQELDVFLAAWLGDEARNSRTISTEIYNSAIRKGLFLLGSDAASAAELIYALKALDTEKKEKSLDEGFRNQSQQIMDKDFVNFLASNPDKVKSKLLNLYKTKIPENQLPTLKSVLDEYLPYSVFHFYSFTMYVDRNEYLEFSNSDIAKDEDIVKKELQKLRFINNKPKPKKKLYDADKVRMVSLFNKIFDLNTPYNKTVIIILQRLYMNYGLITPTTINGRGKQYWFKEPKFAEVWNARRNEMLGYFESELHKIEGQHKVKDLVTAYNATITKFYQSEKILEFYALPLAIIKKYPAFMYALEPENYYAEVMLGQALPPYIFKI